MRRQPSCGEEGAEAGLCPCIYDAGRHPRMDGRRKAGRGWKEIGVSGERISASEEAARPFDVDRIREDFPILARKVYGKPLVYLDNAASAQKPKAVLDAL